jgi:hypothetical protein
MKISRTYPEFEPITLILETKREAEVLFHAVIKDEPKETDAHEFLGDIANWLAENESLDD